MTPELLIAYGAAVATTITTLIAVGLKASAAAKSIALAWRQISDAMGLADDQEDLASLCHETRQLARDNLTRLETLGGQVESTHSRVVLLEQRHANLSCQHLPKVVGK